MKHLQVTLPNNVLVDLYYIHDYGVVAGPYNYIQQSRTNSLYGKPTVHQTEEAYWSHLEQNRMDFANQVPVDFDLIIDMASNSAWHSPYLSAVCRAYPNIPCIYFIKEVGGTGVKAYQDNTAGLAQAKRILIVDDVFQSGSGVARVIDKLTQYGTNTSVKYMIACPLRIPPAAGGSIDEINAAVEEIFGKKSD